MAGNGLVVEKAWSEPPESVLFFTDCVLYIQIRNLSGQVVRIDKIECYFELEEGLEPSIPRRTCCVELARGQLSEPLVVDFKVDLALRSYTNRYRIGIFYNDGSNQFIECDLGQYLVIHPRGPERGRYFICHKDPEDTAVGRQLVQFLHKLGFGGFLSEDERRPGIDLWKEKIAREVKECTAIIILWTARAAKNSRNLYREMRLAKSEGKRFILVKEKAVRAPRGFSQKQVEYFSVDGPIDPSDVKKLACHIYECHRRGDYLELRDES